MPERAARSAVAHDTYRATRHFGSLDGLRFLCISAVIWHHAPIWGRLPEPLDLLERGHVGVDFFFVLSGFLITTLLLREEAERGRFSLRAFYWRRALRILPVYYLVVTLAGFNEIVLNGKTGSLALLPWYYLFLSNFLQATDIAFLDPTWSLAVEEQYYMIWPALLLFLPRRWIAPLLVALIAAHLAAASGLTDRLGITAIEAGPLRIGLGHSTPAILMGSLAALVLHSPAGFARVAPLLAARAMPWMLLATLLAALSLLPQILAGWPNLLVHALMTVVLMSLVVREDNGMAGVLKLWPIARIGQVSYGVYLYHLFALTIMANIFARLGLGSGFALLFAYYALAVAMAEVSFRTFESWFLKLRRKPLHQTAPV